jgi:serine protease Do
MSIWNARFRTFVVLVALLAASMLPALEPSSRRRTPIVQAVGKIMPSVVSIGTNQEQYVQLRAPFRSYYEEFFGRHYYRVVKQYQPLGSGVVVDPSGLVLTNYHVVEGQNELLVHLSDGQSFTARRLAHDHTNDLCLLGLVRPPDAKPLVAASFAVPDDLLLGETVIAVGNPFGLEHSVAQGVLSAKNRTYRSDALTFDDILQTDAAINPGNSGGPLINLDGQLIGINVAIRRDAEGIGFAIPLRRIETVLAGWMIPARETDGRIGLVPGTSVTSDGMQATIASVVPNSPAAKAGLKPGTVVEAINGTPVHRAIDLSRKLFVLKLNDTVKLRLAGGKSVTMNVTRMTTSELIDRRLGLGLQPLTDPLRRALGLPRDLPGLAITEVAPDSDFAHLPSRYGNLVRRGDLLVEVQGKEVNQLAQLDQILRTRTGGMSLHVVVLAIDTVQGRSYSSPLEITVTLD